MSQRSAASLARLTCLALAAMGTTVGTGMAQDRGGAGAVKIPVTTASADARQEYLKGRALGENIRVHDAREILKRVAAKDPTFALAHYNLALSSPTAKEFFDHLKEAVALSGRASEGERLMILGLEAGANANPEKQQEYYQQLVAAYPQDERAHFLLGGNYFGQQDYPKTIAEYQKSVEIAPDFAPAYNLLGYAYRQVGRYDDSEKAFKKYIELIPNDPNPYDSYAELLMKMGRFDESIAMYRKALKTDPKFSPSYIGIASNLMYQGKHDAARAEAWKLHQAARNDADRRNALFARAVAYADEGRLDEAVVELKKQYAVAEKINDAANMAGDAIAMGNVLLEAGKPEKARKLYDKAVALQEGSDLSQEVKDNAKLIHHYNLGRVAVRTKDLAAARRHADAFMQGARAKKNSTQIRQAHELAGTIDLQEKRFDQALAHLTQANQQDPYVLFRMGKAYQGKGDEAKATEMFRLAANHNTLPTLNHAFVRAKAKRTKA
ncbi:MAG TPA: tetratricopeptide repeat protein [Gemmatimonadales bacterium]|nr:tetratricopeptide repeat protein [Gemmatimonadales bacterium]